MAQGVCRQVGARSALACSDLGTVSCRGTRNAQLCSTSPQHAPWRASPSPQSPPAPPSPPAWPPASGPPTSQPRPAPRWRLWARTQRPRIRRSGRSCRRCGAAQRCLPAAAVATACCPPLACVPAAARLTPTRALRSCCKWAAGRAHDEGAGQDGGPRCQGAADLRSSRLAAGSGQHRRAACSRRALGAGLWVGLTSAATSWLLASLA